MALPAGTRLGSYEVVAPIGAGGMGEVYRARDTRLQRDVAIKVLPELFAADPDRLARFEREAQTLAALNHPNIAHIHGVVDLPAQAGSHAVGVHAALVMELVEGEDLAQRIWRGPIPLDEAVPIARQMADALEAAHDLGIVHRDLKPANIRVRPDGTVKVLDFGLAKALHAELGSDPLALANSPTFTANAHRRQGYGEAGTEIGIIIGTAAYMAPEQARGKAVDRRADIWGFGCVLFEMLAAAKPFDGETITDVLSAIISREPEWSKLPSGTPAPLRTLIARCLEKNPRLRLRDIGEARVLLEQPLARAEDTPSRSESRPRGVLAVGALLAALAIAAGGYWGGRWNARPGIAQPLSYKRLTFDDTMVSRARFAPDGVTVVFSAGPGGDPSRLFMTRLDNLGATRLSLPPGELLGLSSSAELALITGVVGARSSILQAGTLARAPLLGGAPRPMQADVSYADWHPTEGQLAIVRTGGYERLEYPAGHLLYETPGQIGVPRFSRDGRRIAFADWPIKSDDRGTVAVVEMDGTKRTLTRQFEGVRGLAWSPDDREVWFSAATEGSNYAIHAATLDGRQRLLATNSTGLVIEDVLRDGRTLARQYDRSVQVGYLGPAATVERDLSWLGGAIARDISPDGQRIAFSYAGEGGGQNYLVFVRDVEGSDAVRIGEGQVQQFSPDGRFVLSVVHGPPSRLLLVPTGTGETTTIPIGNLDITDARWLADGRRIIVVATEAGHGRRAYIGELSGGFRPFSPENIEYAANALCVAGDGRVVLRERDGAIKIFTPDGRAMPVPSLSTGEMPVAWIDGDRALLLPINGERSKFDRLEIPGGKRTLWVVRRPADPGFLARRPQLAFSRDGHSYAANYQLVASRLVLIEGLR